MFCIQSGYLRETLKNITFFDKYLRYLFYEALLQNHQPPCLTFMIFFIIIECPLVDYKSSLQKYQLRGVCKDDIVDSVFTPRYC